jgi:KpsF/GutQ family protein
MNDQQLLRYSRHILLDALGVEGQQRILDSHALIIGAGGLGSPAALYLASAGIGKITLVDDDSVDFTNLQRQIMHNEARGGMAKAESGRQALAALNSEIEVVPLIHRLAGAELSRLVASADLVLDCSVAREACPLNLAPTASTTAQLAMGDALAVALLDARGFRPEDFARSHPGGSLGRKLLTHVSDVMRSGDQVPRVGPEASFSDLMREMSAKGLGCSAIVDAAGHIQGIFTDGDLRRRIEAGADLRTATAAQVMHPSPRRIAPDALAVDAAELMEAHGITSVLVVDAAGVLTGVVHIGDLMRAKVI